MRWWRRRNGHFFNAASNRLCSEQLYRPCGWDKPPVTTSALATVATGMTGVFTQLKLRDQSVSLSDTRFAISSSRLGLADLFTTNIDGSNATQLTNTPNLQESDLAWNQAGNKIAVA